MSYWNAKYTNDRGEYEITFGSNRKEKTKAVERFCQAIIDQKINVANATDILEQLIKAEPVKHGRWIMTPYTTISKRRRKISNKKFACSECGYGNGRKRNNYCPNCGAKMDLEEDDGN